MDSKKYSNAKLFISITNSILIFLFIYLFIRLGSSRELLSAIQIISHGVYLQLILFVVLFGAGISFFTLPLKYYSEFYLEHKYNLSNQNFGQWIWQNAKALVIGSLIGLPVAVFFYFTLIKFGSLWWLPFSILMFIITVVLAKFVVVIILPLFYKISKVENQLLKEKILTLAENAGMKVENIFSFDMSKETKKANAAFTGLGKTKRILLADTLLSGFSEEEIETVIAHELGHYKYRHITKNIFITAAVSFLTFYLISVFYDASLSWFGFEERTDIAALPILILWAMIISLVISPMTNVISRRFEYEVDRYAVNSTGLKDVFVNVLNKLTKQNLGDENPHPLVEFLFYSHPSIKKRISRLTLNTD